MPLQVFPADVSDLRRSHEIEDKAYGPDPSMKILFPGNDDSTPEKQFEDRITQLTQETLDDPTTRWVKVVDTDSGEAIAFARWNIHYPVPAEKKRPWSPHANVEACELVFGRLGDLRRRLTEGKPYVYLASLHTDPAWQGRGAGGMLVQWGIEEANKRKIPCFLEASVSGHRVYTKHGFRVVEEQSTDLSKWGGTEPIVVWVMTRDYVPEPEVKHA